MSNDQIGGVCFNWWKRLTNGKTGRDRADLARLRRAPGVAAALAVRAVHELNTALARAEHDLRKRPDRLALIAMTLAQVAEHKPESLPRRMGQGDPKALSEIRFTSLIQTRKARDLIAPLRRALRATGQRADVARLARDLYWWTDKTRADWCFDYYGAPGAVPEINKSEESSI